MADKHSFTSEESLFAKLAEEPYIKDREAVFALARTVHRGTAAVDKLVRANGKLILEAAFAAVRENRKDCANMPMAALTTRARSGFVRAIYRFNKRSGKRIGEFSRIDVQRAVVRTGIDPNTHELAKPDREHLAMFRSKSKAKKMSAATEAALIRHAQEGQRALETLVTRNTRLVLGMANRSHSKMPAWDRFSEGRMGLMIAIDKFEPDRGFAISTYATHWIRQAINRSMNDQGRLIRIPVH